MTQESDTGQSYCRIDANIFDIRRVARFVQNCIPTKESAKSTSLQMLDQPFAPLAVALPMAIMAIGSAFQASVGIGLALFAVPLLALVDQSFIPGPMLLAGVILALMTAYRERKAIDVPALRSSLVGLVAGTIAGTVALRFASGPLLGKTFGVLVLLAVFLSLTGYRFTATRHSLMIAGGAAGIMGAMVGIHGPAISLVFENAEQGLLAGCWAPSFQLPTWGPSLPSLPSLVSACSECRRLSEQRSYFRASLSGSSSPRISHRTLAAQGSV